MDSPALGASVARRGAPLLDGFDRAGLVARAEEQAVADLDGTGLDAPGENAAFVEAINVLESENAAVDDREGRRP